MRANGLIVFLLIVATGVVFAPVRDFDFVNLDDPLYVTDNAQLESGLNSENLAWAFTNTHTTNWYPLTWLSLLCDVELYGISPGGFHVTAVVWHALNAILLFVLLERTTGARWSSAVVALLFAVHPLHVESVAWVSGRKDVVSTLFGLLSLIAYAEYARERRLGWYAACFIAMACSLMSKQMLVTLPFVFLLMDFWPLRRVGVSAKNSDQATPGNDDTRQKSANRTTEFTCEPVSWMKLVVEKMPLFALAISFSVIAFITKRNSPVLEASDVYSMGTRAANAVVAYALYVKNTVWPTGLAPYYPHPGDSISSAAVMASAAFLVVVTVLAIAQWRKRPYLLVGWFWFLGTLVPVIGVIQVGGQQMADRYTYVPLIGLFIAVAWLVPSLLPSGTMRRVVLPGVVAASLIVLMVVARVQAGHWRDSILLWNHTLAVAVPSAVAHNNLGIAKSELGQWDEAIEHFLEAIRIDAEYSRARHNLAEAILAPSRLPNAKPYYRRIIANNPDDWLAHNDLAALLTHERQFETAIVELQRSLEINPEAAETHFQLAHVFETIGNREQAIQHLQQCIRLRPDDEDAIRILRQL